MEQVPLKTFKLTGTSQIHRECEYIAAEFGIGQLSEAGGDYALNRQGAIIFFSLSQPGRCAKAPVAADFSSIPGVLEVAINAASGKEYPATSSLLDALDLGLAFIDAANAAELDERCLETRTTFDSAFTSTVRV
ncbi:hypothetical protein OG203_31975 [Nocardia sp. NBC_01499]|uniref:hypothetical protein n=1 Tax=Nocardia sp. NBC_01499 TaxID=2903597 RepID=UPI00386949A2